MLLRAASSQSTKAELQSLLFTVTYNASATKHEPCPSLPEHIRSTHLPWKSPSILITAARSQFAHTTEHRPQALWVPGQMATQAMCIRQHLQVVQGYIENNTNRTISAAQTAAAASVSIADRTTMEAGPTESSSENWSHSDRACPDSFTAS